MAILGFVIWVVLLPVLFFVMSDGRGRGLGGVYGQAVYSRSCSLRLYIIP